MTTFDVLPARPRPRSRGRRAVVCGLAALLAVGSLSACGAPRGVTPLLRVSREVMLREARQQTTDLQRERMHIDQNRAALRSAFAADLAARAQLDARWVSDAAEVYAAAQAALATEIARREAERQTRADNLLAAADAQSRAINLIEQQNAILKDALAIDAWLSRLLLGTAVNEGATSHE